jgi:hypothetical protein
MKNQGSFVAFLVEMTEKKKRPKPIESDPKFLHRCLLYLSEITPQPIRT